MTQLVSKGVIAQSRAPALSRWEMWVFPAVAVVLALAVLYYGVVDGLRPGAMAVSAAAVMAGGVAPWWPRASAVTAVVLASMAVVLMPDQYTGALSGLLLPLVACMTAGHVWFSAALALWVLSLHIADYWDSVSSPTLAGFIPSIGLEFALVGCAALIGYALREGRRRRDQESSDTIVALRREISRELHDTVAYELSVAALRADICQEQGQASSEDLEIIAGQCRLAIADMRSIVRLLRAEDPHHPRRLVVPAKALIDQRSEALKEAGFQWAQQVDFEFDQLPRSVNETLSRILVEVFNNIERHAAPGQCSLIASWTGPQVEVSITNPYRANGAATSDRPKFGILGMSERATAAGGSLTATAHAQRWMVHFSLPAAQVRTA